MKIGLNVGKYIDLQTSALQSVANSDDCHGTGEDNNAYVTVISIPQFC